MNLENSLSKIEVSPFGKVIVLPTSKSHSNRALIIGAIRGNGFTIQNLSQSTDVLTLLYCLQTIGLDIEYEDDLLVFHNSFPECESNTSEDVIDLETGDGGTTNRFLLALLSRGKKMYRLFPSEKMSERPMEDLINPLKKLKVNIETFVDGASVCIKGPAQIINGDRLEINCRFSTQFASAMMLAFSADSIIFDLKNINASEMYLKMTEDILEQSLINNTYNIPIDFSSLSYPLALALLRGKVLLRNCLHIDPLQPDSQFIHLMEKAGGDIEWTEHGLIATNKFKLTPFDVDGSKFPDLIPTLVFVAAHIEGRSTLRHLSVLRHKESDRVEEILKLLKAFSIDFSFDDSIDELIINGKLQCSPPVTITTARDHRMVMTAYLFLRANSGGYLAETDCIEKSFPDFLYIM